MYKYNSLIQEEKKLLYGFEDNNKLVLLEENEISFFDDEKEEFKKSFSDIDCLLSARFHEIFLGGMKYLEILYCNKYLKQINKDKDFEVGCFLVSVEDEEQVYGHAFSYIISKEDKKKLYIFDSGFGLNHNDNLKNAHNELMKEKNRTEIEYICPNCEQGNSNLCAIYMIMFCRLVSQCKNFDEFLSKKDKKEGNKTIIDDVNENIKQLICKAPISQEIKEENIKKFEERKIGIEKVEELDTIVNDFDSYNSVNSHGSWTKTFK